MEHRFPPVKEKYEARYCWRLPAGKGWERLGLRRDGDCVIIKAQKMMGHYDFAAAGSSVRKNSWMVCWYGLMVKYFMAGSYCGIKRNGSGLSKRMKEKEVPPPSRSGLG